MKEHDYSANDYFNVLSDKGEIIIKDKIYSLKDIANMVNESSSLQDLHEMNCDIIKGNTQELIKLYINKIGELL